MDIVVRYLTQRGWIEIFSNRPGDDFGSHGFVVPIKGKVVDCALLKGDQIMLVECDSNVTFKKKYHIKLLDIKDYLLQDDHLERWKNVLESRNKIMINKISRILLALAYHTTDFRFNMIKPELVTKGFLLFKVTNNKSIIEEHKIIKSEIKNFLK
jgi:hypothetical protein